MHLLYCITGIDFLDRLLSFDPRIRPTAEQALGKLLLYNHSIFFLHCVCYLAHPFLHPCHIPEKEPTIEPIVDEHQDAEYTIAQWKCKSFE